MDRFPQFQDFGRSRSNAVHIALAGYLSVRRSWGRRRREGCTLIATDDNVVLFPTDTMLGVRLFGYSDIEAVELGGSFGRRTVRFLTKEGPLEVHSRAPKQLLAQLIEFVRRQIGTNTENEPLEARYALTKLQAEDDFNEAAHRVDDQLAAALRQLFQEENAAEQNPFSDSPPERSRVAAEASTTDLPQPEYEHALRQLFQEADDNGQSGALHSTHWNTTIGSIASTNSAADVATGEARGENEHGSVLQQFLAVTEQQNGAVKQFGKAKYALTRLGDEETHEQWEEALAELFAEVIGLDEGADAAKTRYEPKATTIHGDEPDGRNNRRRKVLKAARLRTRAAPVAKFDNARRAMAKLGAGKIDAQGEQALSQPFSGTERKRSPVAAEDAPRRLIWPKARTAQTDAGDEIDDVLRQALPQTRQHAPEEEAGDASFARAKYALTRLGNDEAEARRQDVLAQLFPRAEALLAGKGSAAAKRAAARYLLTRLEAGLDTGPRQDLLLQLFPRTEEILAHSGRAKTLSAAKYALTSLRVDEAGDPRDDELNQLLLTAKQISTEPSATDFAARYALTKLKADGSGDEKQTTKRGQSVLFSLAGVQAAEPPASPSDEDLSAPGRQISDSSLLVLLKNMLPHRAYALPMLALAIFVTTAGLLSQDWLLNHDADLSWGSASPEPELQSGGELRDPSQGFPMLVPELAAEPTGSFAPRRPGSAVRPDPPLSDPGGGAIPVRYDRDNHQLVGKMIAERRNAIGLSRAELASAIGRDTEFIASVENGSHQVGLVELLKISKTIGLDLHLILDKFQ